MNDLILMFTLGIILLSIFLQYESKHSELTYVKSDIDGNEYLVRNREDKLKAANMIAKIKNNLNKIVDYLKKNNISDPKVRRLSRKMKTRPIIRIIT